MPDALAQLLGIEGLGWVFAAALVGGVVRGFSGFGTAMIYLPVAAQVVPPVWAIVTLTVMDLFGPVPNLAGAWKQAQRRDLALLISGTVVMLPVGLMLLAALSPETYRYIVSLLALVMVLCLVLGLRYSGALRPPLIAGIGAAAGLTGGVAGVPGPPVILFYMASRLPVAVVRANVLLFLVAFDVLILGMILARGDVAGQALILGLVLAVPNLIGNVIGAAVFNPDRAGLYRGVAYAIVAGSALMGLPLFD